MTNGDYLIETKMFNSGHPNTRFVWYSNDQNKLGCQMFDCLNTEPLFGCLGTTC